jgi:hypothetical protein
MYLPLPNDGFADAIPQWSRIRPGSLVHLPEGNWERENIDLYEEQAAGWPFESLRLWRTARENKTFGYDTVASCGLLSIPWRNGFYTTIHLPYIPIWRDFAINMIFYAAILWAVWMLFAVPGVVKRHRRRKRGLCPACAYPIGESKVCTECGAAVRTSKCATPLF